MKSLTIKLPIKPRSINNKLIPRKGRLINNPEYAPYLKELMAVMASNRKDLYEFALNYNHDEHAVEAVWNIYIPEDKYFTKRGTISKTCIDATNAVKMLEDALVKFINIDDSQFIETAVRKIPVKSSEWCVVLELERVLRPRSLDVSLTQSHSP